MFDSSNSSGINGHRSWQYKVTSTSDELAVSSDAVLAHLKIDLPDASELERINSIIRAATAEAERHTRRLLLNREITTYRDSFPENELGFEIKRSPLNSLVSLKVLNSDGDYEDVDVSSHKVYYDEAYSFIGLKPNKSWGISGCERDLVEIKVICGVGDNASDVADAYQNFPWVPIMIHGIMMHCAYLNENKGDCSGKCSTRGNLPSDIATLYDSIRIESVAIYNTN